jgi:hypothetical protein
MDQVISTEEHQLFRESFKDFYKKEALILKNGRKRYNRTFYMEKFGEMVFSE